jgi:hypothetical protein
MFSNIANAIALEAGFRETSLGGFTGPTDPSNVYQRTARRDFINAEFMELRVESGLPEGTRAITSEMLATAVAFKYEMKERARRAVMMNSPTVTYVVYKGTPQIATSLRKYRYERNSAAVTAAKKAGPGYEAVDAFDRIARLRLRLVRSAFNGALVMERNDTSFSLSVASESYWQN